MSCRLEADAACSIMQNILPENHLYIASSKRVKALILEEIAIDCRCDDTGL